MVSESREDSGLHRKEMFRLLFAHHPPCATFQTHTLRLGRIRLCIGCFIGYPSAVVALLVSFNFLSQFPWSPWWLVIFGIVFVLSQLWSFFSFSQRKLIKIIQKMLIGTGSGMILAGVFNILDQPLWMKILSLWSTILLIIGPIGLFHYFTMKSVCNQCQQKQDLGYCPETISFADHRTSNSEISTEPKKK